MFFKVLSNSERTLRTFISYFQHHLAQFAIQPGLEPGAKIEEEAPALWGVTQPWPPAAPSGASELQPLPLNKGTMFWTFHFPQLLTLGCRGEKIFEIKWWRVGVVALLKVCKITVNPGLHLGMLWFKHTKSLAWTRFLSMRSDTVPVLFFGLLSDVSPSPGIANSFMPMFLLVSVCLENKWFSVVTFPHKCFHQVFQKASGCRQRSLSNIFMIPSDIFMISLINCKINLVIRYVLENSWVKEMSESFRNVISASWLALVSSFESGMGHFHVAWTLLHQ